MTHLARLSTNLEVSNTTLIRRQNLFVLFQEFTERHLNAGGVPKGVEQLFAQQLQLSPSRLSQIKSSRPIGDKLARQIESMSGRKQGWLDDVHTESKPTQAEEAFVKMALDVWRKQNTTGRRQLMKQIRGFVLS